MLSQLRIKRNRAGTKQKLLAHGNHHPKVFKLKKKKKLLPATGELMKTSGDEKGQKVVSVKKGTNLNRCKVRRNPYSIYS